MTHTHSDGGAGLGMANGLIIGLLIAIVVAAVVYIFAFGGFGYGDRDGQREGSDLPAPPASMQYEAPSHLLLVA